MLPREQILQCILLVVSRINQMFLCLLIVQGIPRNGRMSSLVEGIWTLVVLIKSQMILCQFWSIISKYGFESGESCVLLVTNSHVAIHVFVSIG